MQLSAAGLTLIASLPMDLTAFRTKSTSTSEAYLSVEIRATRKQGEDRLTPRAQPGPLWHSLPWRDGT